jgi:hypothetical protein
MHRRIECQVMLSQQRLSLCGFCAFQPDGGNIIEHRSLSQAILDQVLHRKLVLGILLRSDEESNASDLNCLNGSAFPWCWHQAQLGTGIRGGRSGLGKRAGSGAQQKQGNFCKTTAHRHNLDDL